MGVGVLALPPPTLPAQGSPGGMNEPHSSQFSVKRFPQLRSLVTVCPDLHGMCPFVEGGCLVNGAGSENKASQQGTQEGPSTPSQTRQLADMDTSWPGQGHWPVA